MGVTTQQPWESRALPETLYRCAAGNGCCDKNYLEAFPPGQLRWFRGRDYREALPSEFNLPGWYCETCIDYLDRAAVGPFGLLLREELVRRAKVRQATIIPRKCALCGGSQLQRMSWGFSCRDCGYETV